MQLEGEARRRARGESERKKGERPSPLFPFIWKEEEAPSNFSLGGLRKKGMNGKEATCCFSPSLFLLHPSFRHYRTSPAAIFLPLSSAKKNEETKEGAAAQERVKKPLSSQDRGSFVLDLLGAHVTG